MVYRVKEAFSFDRDGVPVTLRVGMLLNADDPRVRGHEQFLEPAERHAARTGPTETATAAPGERRSVSTAPDLDALRAQAEAVGVTVDKRWGVDRLRQEIQQAETTA